MSPSSDGGSRLPRHPPPHGEVTALAESWLRADGYALSPVGDRPRLAPLTPIATPTGASRYVPPALMVFVLFVLVGYPAMARLLFP